MQMGACQRLKTKKRTIPQMPNKLKGSVAQFLVWKLGILRVRNRINPIYCTLLFLIELFKLDVTTVCLGAHTLLVTAM
jgi:hypothetical protein